MSKDKDRVLQGHVHQQRLCTLRGGTKLDWTFYSR